MHLGSNFNRSETPISIEISCWNIIHITCQFDVDELKKHNIYLPNNYVGIRLFRLNFIYNLTFLSRSMYLTRLFNRTQYNLDILIRFNRSCVNLKLYFRKTLWSNVLFILLLFYKSQGVSVLRKEQDTFFRNQRERNP